MVSLLCLLGRTLNYKKFIASTNIRNSWMELCMNVYHSATLYCFDGGIDVEQ